MYAKAIPAEAETTEVETANDRFKRSFGSWFWSSMITATVFHFIIFQFWPTQTADNVAYTAGELEIIDLPPDIEIPPPPETISRPATPMMSLADMSTAPSLVGGGGKSSIGLSANVVGAIVMSSSISVRAITGVAGREIASGGGGISISGGSSIISNSSAVKDTSSAVCVGQN